MACPCARAADDDIEFFEKRIRPLLAERCETCHSAKSGKTNGGLALDSKDGWTKGGESGAAVVPGRPDESLLIRAVRYGDDGPQMPPAEKGGKLPDTEIAALEEWVRRGALDPRVLGERVGGMSPEEARSWWSFQPLARVEPPHGDGDSSAGPIDRFLLAAMQPTGLSPAGAADRHTLIRRATFDLTGLPPTPEEVEAFVADESPEAFARVVDRLLASTAYGQRWARHWLDLARYADYCDANPAARVASCEPLEAFRYRDWVVDALNRDLPYDQFIVHQIAGDLLKNPTGEEVYPDGLVATTFLTNGVWDRGDADKEKIVSDMVDDNIDVIGKAFMGLTLGCARCHDHKFDPITTEDYYALAGIFYSSHLLADLGIKGGEYTFLRTPLAQPAAVALRQQQEQELALRQAALLTFEQRQRYRDYSAGGRPLLPTRFESQVGATAEISGDGVVRVTGANGRDVYRLTAVVPEGPAARYVRLEPLTDGALPAGGPGRASDGNFVLTGFAVSLVVDGAEQPRPLKIVSARANFEQSNLPVAQVIDENPDGGWAVHPAFGQDHVAVFELAAETPLSAGAAISVELQQRSSDSHTLGRFRLSVTDALAAPSPEGAAERKRLFDERDQFAATMVPPIPTALAMAEGGMKGGLFPGIQDVPVHVRGSYTRLGKVVPRRMPRILAGESPSPISAGSGRSELAQFVASANNPLTPRVIVNRLWQWHFGEGLVRTPSNFGKLGERPSHPELLDFLARTFIEEDGWSLKRLHRRIMLTDAYQRASRVPRELVERDAENRFLARFSPRRLEAEAIRDAMLMASGRLDQAPLGPAGDDHTILRRSLYVQTARWDRASYATLFDAANPDASVESRVASTVAPQSLMLLNHAFFLDQARHLAARLAREVPQGGASRIERAHRILYGRAPSADELRVAEAFLTSAGMENSEQAWADLAHVLLCANEFVYLD